MDTWHEWLCLPANNGRHFAKVFPSALDQTLGSVVEYHFPSAGNIHRLVKNLLAQLRAEPLPVFGLGGTRIPGWDY